MDGGGVGSLSNLLSVHLSGEYPRLEECAQILRAAPLLQAFTSSDTYEHLEVETATIRCRSSTPTTGTDLFLLHERMSKLTGIRDATYLIVCSYQEIIRDRQNGIPGSLQPFIASLPTMTGVTKLDLSCIEPADLASILHKFPDLQELMLRCQYNMNDVELQHAAAANKLVSLKFLICREVTPMGLLALCQRLPNLSHVTCVDCTSVEQTDLDRCAELLMHSTQRKVVFVERRVDEDEEESEDEM